MASIAYPLVKAAESGSEIPGFSFLTWNDLGREPYSSIFRKVGVNGGKYSQTGLATAGVDGCSVLIARAVNGSGAHGIMTHYVPVYLAENRRKMREMARRHGGLVSGNARVRIFHASCYDKMAGKLEEEAVRLFGYGVNLRKIPYGVVEKRTPFMSAEGVFMFDVSSGEYWFRPFGEEDLNPDFHGFI
jgi:hypothetical protein